ncbi:calcium-binding protein [Methylocaldum sp. MU1018]
MYQGLALQTWLKPYLDAISFTFTGTGLTLDFSGLSARLDTLYQTDAGNALTDLIGLNRYAGDGLRNSGWTGLETLRTWVDGAVGNAGLEAILQDLHVARGSGNFAGTATGDILFGGSTNDVLDGQAGDDILEGGGGTDTLLGGEGNDYLYGDAGDDVLEGGAGTDYLSGGVGSDTYRFGRGDGQDTISDYESSANADQLLFGADIAVDQLWFRHVGSNLEVSVIGTNDKATISNWYSGTAYHIEQFQTADGRTLLDSQVENLVSAMAAFAPPSAGQTTLPQNYQDALNSVIAANWQ